MPSHTVGQTVKSLDHRLSGCGKKVVYKGSLTDYKYLDVSTTNFLVTLLVNLLKTQLKSRSLRGVNPPTP
jgi:hypothetical protein